MSKPYGNDSAEELTKKELMMNTKERIKEVLKLVPPEKQKQVSQLVSDLRKEISTLNGKLEMANAHLQTTETERLRLKTQLSEMQIKHDAIIQRNENLERDRGERIIEQKRFVDALRNYGSAVRGHVGGACAAIAICAKEQEIEDDTIQTILYGCCVLGEQLLGKDNGIDFVSECLGEIDEKMSINPEMEHVALRIRNAVSSFNDEHQTASDGENHERVTGAS